MTFGSVCSGIEAASVAWEPLGWRCAFIAEIDKFPCALLKHYYSAVPNYGDLNAYAQWPQQPIDVLVGGTPCQDFSVAGQRAGMAGDRGGLTMRFLDIVGRYAPAWVVWENVPGVLSIDGGRAFGSFLGGLAKRGYGFAYRVLDAQYFGLAQRRERVFVVGCAGGRWQCAAAVLFDAPRLRWNPPPSRETGQGTAPSISARTQGGGGLGTDAECDGALIEVSGSQAYNLQSFNSCAMLGDGDSKAANKAEIARCQDASWLRAQQGGTIVAHSLTAEGHDASEDGTGRSVPLIAVAFQEAQTGVREYETAGALRANGPGHDPVGTRVRSGMSVRRLTPREVERLFGFPDDYTLIPYRGKPACDGPRSRALGNSMAVPVMRWIGRRIELVSTLA